MPPKKSTKQHPALPTSKSAVAEAAQAVYDELCKARDTFRRELVLRLAEGAGDYLIYCGRYDDDSRSKKSVDVLLSIADQLVDRVIPLPPAPSPQNG